MRMVCLDVEGVLLPEIWKAISKQTGIAALARTTQDEPDYAVLMAGRLSALRDAKIGFDALISIAKGIDPLPGAVEFLSRLRRNYQVALISDSYYDFLQPLSFKLGSPAIYCHRLLRGVDGDVEGWQPRLVNQKPKCVQAFQGLGFEVFAAGDSFNDIGMLEVADHAAFINAPALISASLPHIAACDNYHTLEILIHTASWRIPAV